MREVRASLTGWVMAGLGLFAIEGAASLFTPVTEAAEGGEGTRSPTPGPVLDTRASRFSVSRVRSTSVSGMTRGLD